MRTKHKRSRRKHKRSRYGCLTCKQRKIKCDEVKPTCGACKRSARQCMVNHVKKVDSSMEFSDSLNIGSPIPSREASIEKEREGDFNGTSGKWESKEALNISYAQSPPLPVHLGLSQYDQRLLDYFLYNVVPTFFPLLEMKGSGLALHYILPALQTNRYFLYCCLGIAAQSIMNIQGDKIDNDTIRYRDTTVSGLCDALKHNTSHKEILEATMGMILFQRSVSRYNDCIPDIPWHQHFRAAISLVQKLELNRLAIVDQVDFNMTLTAWIDILGSTVQGQTPAFANTYREKNISSTNTSLGLRELMGCEDRVMYIISEIACLDALKQDGMNNDQLCQHVQALRGKLNSTTGVLNPDQLSKSITTAFCLAAHIYLCTLTPGFAPSQASCVSLVSELTQVLEFIPNGEDGFDRSMVWVYIIGGSVSTASSPFRTFFSERLFGLGSLAVYGSFGHVVRVLKEVWRQGDNISASEAHYVSWRNVMQMNDWDYLLL